MQQPAGLTVDAEGGERLGQFKLALAYARGRGLPKDPSQAFSWCRKAAENSWPAAEKTLDRDERKNASAGGEVLFVEASRCSLFAEGAVPGRMTVFVGVEDLIVVDSDDVVLICRRDCAGDVKNAVEELRRRGREDLL